MEPPTVVGMAGVPGRGRFLVFYLRVANDQVERAQFECHGCGVTIACGSVTTELVERRTLAECAALQEDDISLALEGIPADKGDCAGFAIQALRDALSKLSAG